MAVRLDVEPTRMRRYGHDPEREGTPAPRRGRRNLNPVKLARRKPAPAALLDEPLVLPYLCRA